MLRFLVFVLSILANFAAAEEWVERGCWGDRIYARVLPEYYGGTGVAFPDNPADSNLRPMFEACRKGAETKGYTYFGIQNKVECWGGKKGAEYKKHGKTDCFMGKDGFQVGGPDANAVYIIKVDGGYSQWSKWSECGKTCGQAIKVRTRTCTNPKPRGAGEQCKGADSDRTACSLPVCPVNGGWTDYGDFTSCSKTCGGGEQVRARCCSNPKPSPGGEKCSGSNVEIKPCNTHPCT